MKKQLFLTDYVKICDLHAERLQDALLKIKNTLPLTAEKFETMTSDQVMPFDMIALRFSQLQDLIGAKVFPLTLNLLAEDAQTLIDKLNKLEKFGYIEDANWWLELRETRNHVTHDYPDEYKALAKHFNKLAKQVGELLTFWTVFKEKISLLQK